MGVINLTPNSFALTHQMQSHSQTLELWNQALSDFDIIDVGAESSAPFNDPIDGKTELARLKEFFTPLLNELADPVTVVSIDSYRPQVFFEVGALLKQFWPKTKLIYNDISGKLDEELFSLLKSDLDFDYVFSHNLCSERSLAGSHMQFLYQAPNFCEHIIDYFAQGLEQLGAFHKRIIVDPCFGFSKTREQNHELLARLGELFCACPRLLIGISRKSFLRTPEMDPKNSRTANYLDHLQSILFARMTHDLAAHRFEGELILRVHDKLSVKALRESMNLLAGSFSSGL